MAQAEQSRWPTVSVSRGSRGSEFVVGLSMVKWADGFRSKMPSWLRIVSLEKAQIPKLCDFLGFNYLLLSNLRWEALLFWQSWQPFQLFVWLFFFALYKFRPILRFNGPPLEPALIGSGIRAHYPGSDRKESRTDRAELTRGAVAFFADG